MSGMRALDTFRPKDNTVGVSESVRDMIQPAEACGRIIMEYASHHLRLTTREW